MRRNAKALARLAARLSRSTCRYRVTGIGLLISAVPLGDRVAAFVGDIVSYNVKARSRLLKAVTIWIMPFVAQYNLDSIFGKHVAAWGKGKGRLDSSTIR